MKKHILFATLTVISIFLLTACSPAAQMERPAAAPAATPPPAAQATPPPPAQAPPPAATAPSPAPAAPAPAQDLAPAPETNYFMFPTLTPSRAGDRRLVYTLNMRLQTSEFLPGMRTLLNTVGELEGYLITANVHGYDLRNPSPDRSANFRFRVPTENLAEFIFVIENNYNIWSMNQEMQEVTSAYQHNVWGLEELREHERTLLELLEDAEGNERTAALNSLSDVRRSIREFESAQAGIMSNVIYSTIDIQLFEAIPIYETEQPEQLIVIAFLILFATAIVVIVVLVTKNEKRAPKVT